jgi:hypothetical protein
MLLTQELLDAKLQEVRELLDAWLCSVDVPPDKEVVFRLSARIKTFYPRPAAVRKKYDYDIQDHEWDAVLKLKLDRREKKLLRTFRAEGNRLHRQHEILEDCDRGSTYRFVSDLNNRFKELDVPFHVHIFGNTNRRSYRFAVARPEA